MTKQTFTGTAQTDTIWTAQTHTTNDYCYTRPRIWPCAVWRRLQVELFNNTGEAMLNFVGLEGFVEESKSSGADITCSYKKRAAAATVALCQWQRTQWPLRPTFFSLWKCQLCLLGEEIIKNNILFLESQRCKRISSLSLVNRTLCSKAFWIPLFLMLTNQTRRCTLDIHTQTKIRCFRKSLNALKKKQITLVHKHPAFSCSLRELNENERGGQWTLIQQRLKGHTALLCGHGNMSSWAFKLSSD